jgi:hypothetical protein
MLSVALLTLVASGCYRATGLQRTPLAAEVIPETGGDRVAGLKSTAGPGDYFLGNDFIQLAIDGTPFGSPVENVIAGAKSGGSIVDAGYVLLDTSFRRVSAPGDAMDRLTPVVNQDPNLELVFDRFTPKDLGDTSMVIMEGYLLDPAHTIAGATWDSAGRVAGVTVTHTVSMDSLTRYATLQTILTNNTAATLGIHNIGDFLTQKGGGYRFAVPATYDAAGSVLSPRWGMEIPGSDFTRPLATAVKAPLVGLLSAELAAATLDSHASVGFLPMDADNFLVTCDAQNALEQQIRPIFPERMVVGGLPIDSLAPGATLTHNRRLFVLGGQSIDGNATSSTTGLFNAMDREKYTNVRVADFGYFQFDLSGTAQRQGPLASEVRIERNVGTTAAPIWELSRVEWLEPTDNVATTGSLPPSTIQSILPVGTYRVVVRNQNDEYAKTLFTNVFVDPANTADDSVHYLPQTVQIVKDKLFQSSSTDLVNPEVKSTTDALGEPTSTLYAIHMLSTHERDSEVGSVQPQRFTLVGTNGTPDPIFRRQRTVATYYSAVSKAPEVYTPGLTPGQYQFRAGNEVFGTGFTNALNTQLIWLPNPKAGAASDNTYIAYATRGPLSFLEQQDLTAFEGQGNTSHAFTIFPMALPSGWTSFDMPGPSQATTGGFNPGEKLASAMAEGVQVVAHTEQDLQVDAQSLYDDFRKEFSFPAFTDNQRPASLSDITRTTLPWTSDPFVVAARSSFLEGYGTVSALFTPVPTGARNGGARLPKAWTLADFLKQAEGQFNVVHRPRGPQGLFTLKGFNPAVPLGQGVNAWWTGGGLYAFGQTNGGFDALELLRGEGLDRNDPTIWFNEFKAVRADWFALLNQQTPANFTKALGLSSGVFSLDTPVGLARTYVKNVPATETDLTGLLAALKSGAAVASTGPFLNVSVGTTGPGGLVSGPAATVSLQVSLTRTNWMTVNELRVVVNGQVVQTIDPATLTVSATDPTIFTGTFPVTMPVGKDGWIVVEAGVPLATSGPFAPGTPWNLTMRGIYPIAVTNPIFVDVTGGGYTPPML